VFVFIKIPDPDKFLTFCCPNRLDSTKTDMIFCGTFLVYERINFFAWGLALRDYRKYWVGSNMVKGIGAVRLQLLLDHFGDAQTAWQAHPEQLSATGLTPTIIKNLIKLRESVSLDHVWDRIQAHNIQVVIIGDDPYPIRL
jgi:hypothetical protein